MRPQGSPKELEIEKVHWTHQQSKDFINYIGKCTEIITQCVTQKNNNCDSPRVIWISSQSNITEMHLQLSKAPLSALTSKGNQKKKDYMTKMKTVSLKIRNGKRTELWESTIYITSPEERLHLGDTNQELGKKPLLRKRNKSQGINIF